MCVFRRDHHCSFGAVCVGHFNQRYFMASILNLLPLMAALTKWVLFNLQYYYEFHFQSDLGLHLDQNGWPVHSRQDLAAVPSSSSPRCQVISSPIQRLVCQYKCWWARASDLLYLWIPYLQVHHTLPVRLSRLSRFHSNCLLLHYLPPLRPALLSHQWTDSHRISHGLSHLRLSQKKPLYRRFMPTSSVSSKTSNRPSARGGIWSPYHPSSLPLCPPTVPVSLPVISNASPRRISSHSVAQVVHILDIINYKYIVLVHSWWVVFF